MIGNSVKGRGFRGCLNYNLNPDKGAQLIGGNMTGNTARSLAQEFGEVRRLNQRVKTPCWHISLSAVPGEKLSDAQWSQVAERYLDNMEFDRKQHQYVVVRHNDTRHQHVHIVANRVAMDGSANYVKWHLKDTKKATRRLEQELSYLQPTCLDQNKAKLEQDYQQPAVEPPQRRETIKGQYQRHRRETAQDKNPPPIIQQRLQEVAGRVLPQSQNLDDFIARLSVEGIEAKIRIRRERQVGISYRLDGVALRGNTLGEDYSWKKLQHHFEQLQPAPPVKIQGVNDGAERTVQEHPDRRENLIDPSEGNAQAEPDHATDVEVSPRPHRRSEAARAEDAEHRGRFTGLGAVAGDFAALEPVAADTARLGGQSQDAQRSPESDRDSCAASERDGDQYSELRASDPDVGAAVAGDENGAAKRPSKSRPSSQRAAPRRNTASGTVESDSGVAERKTDGDQGHHGNARLDSVSSQRPQRIDRNDGGERQLHVNAGADQQSSEQSRHSDDQGAQAVEVEQQRLLAIAQGWSDAELLDIEQRVQSYFKQEMPEPDWDRGQQLRAERERLAEQRVQMLAIAAEQQQEVQWLGVARSWKHPFGAPPAAVRAAERQLQQTKQNLSQLKQQLGQAQENFSRWQEPTQRHHKWRYSELGEEMHQNQKVLQLAPVQERLTGICQAQQRQKVLKTLQEWRVIAVRLNHSEAYIKRVEEVTAEYAKGRLLNENATAAMSRDFLVYQEREKQVRQQRQVKSQLEQGGFSL